MAEGRYNTPELAKTAIEIGAYCVTVGSALTSLRAYVSWFTEAIHSAKKIKEEDMSLTVDSGQTLQRCLALDIGGTKIASAIVKMVKFNSENRFLRHKMMLRKPCIKPLRSC